MQRHDESSPLRSLLVEEGLWARKSSEGTNSLFRAVSVGLYFTERYQDVIKKLVLCYFSQVRTPQLKTDSQVKAVERYFQNMTLVGFEPINLEIVGRLFSVNPTIYYLDADQLRHQSFGQESLPPLRLLRVHPMSYAALFLRSQKPDYIFAQNVVLGLVERALGAGTPDGRPINGNKLINFDYRRWLSQSKLLASNGAEAPPVDYQAARLVSTISPGKKAAVEENLLRTAGASTDVGTEIISLFRKRKNSIRSKHELPADNPHPFLANNFADKNFFLKTSHQDKTLKRSQSLRSGKGGYVPKATDPHELAGEWVAVDSLHEQHQSSHNHAHSGDHGSESDNSNQVLLDADERDKPGDLEEVLAFALENDFADGAVDNSLRVFESKLAVKSEAPEGQARPLPEGGPAPVSADKPKQAKVPLKEKLKQKQILTNGKLELSKGFSLQEPFSLGGNGIRAFNPPERSFLLSSVDPRAEASHKLLSELKGAAFGKEKYSEIVDHQYYTGILKFFDEKNGFGFFQIVKEADFEDVFVYKSEFDKADIKVEALKTMKSVFGQTFRFQIATYSVQGDKRKKAINIKLA